MSELVVSPVAIFNAEELVTVYENCASQHVVEQAVGADR
jgi:hypothetical protein